MPVVQAEECEFVSKAGGSETDFQSSLVSVLLSSEFSERPSYKQNKNQEARNKPKVENDRKHPTLTAGLTHMAHTHAQIKNETSAAKLIFILFSSSSNIAKPFTHLLLNLPIPRLWKYL